MPVKMYNLNSSAPSLKGGMKDVVGVDENNIHACTCAHVHAQGRKEAGKEREKEGRKRKKGRNKGTHLNFPTRMGTCRQGVRVALVYPSLP